MTETTKMVIKIASGIAIVVIGTYKIIKSKKESAHPDEEGTD